MATGAASKPEPSGAHLPEAGSSQGTLCTRKNRTNLRGFSFPLNAKGLSFLSLIALDFRTSKALAGVVIVTMDGPPRDSSNTYRANSITSWSWNGIRTQQDRLSQ